MDGEKQYRPPPLPKRPIIFDWVCNFYRANGHVLTGSHYDWVWVPVGSHAAPACWPAGWLAGWLRTRLGSVGPGDGRTWLP